MPEERGHGGSFSDDGPMRFIQLTILVVFASIAAVMPAWRTAAESREPPTAARSVQEQARGEVQAGCPGENQNGGSPCAVLTPDAVLSKILRLIGKHHGFITKQMFEGEFRISMNKVGPTTNGASYFFAHRDTYSRFLVSVNQHAYDFRAPRQDSPVGPGSSTDFQFNRPSSLDGCIDYRSARDGLINAGWLYQNTLQMSDNIVTFLRGKYSEVRIKTPDGDQSCIEDVIIFSYKSLI
jgi:hypothetical protein